MSLIREARASVELDGETQSYPIRFHVNGTPKPQPRPRAFARRIGNNFAARVYDAGTAEAWKSEIAIAARDHLPQTPLAGPLELSVHFYLPRPKGHFAKSGSLAKSAPEHHTNRPDVDNLVKAVLDCMTQLGFWGDDDQIVRLVVTKEYFVPTGCQIELGPVVLYPPGGKE